MKKAVTLIVLAVFVASVVIISFFGMSISSYRDSIPVREIVLTNPNVIEEFRDGQSNNFIILNWADDNTNGEVLFILDWRVLPENATDRSVTLSLSQSSVNTEIVDYRAGVISLKVRNARADITITANDGSDRSVNVVIIAR